MQTAVQEHGPTERSIVITINDNEYEISVREMTGRELLALAGLPETNHLFLDVPGPRDDEQVGLDEPIRLRPQMRFYDVPVGNFG